MNRIISGFFSLALIMAPSFGQARQLPPRSRCTLTEASSPAIRGLRLGMSIEQALALFPGSSKRWEMRDAIERARSHSGGETVYLAFDPSADARGESFSGVDSVSVGIYKGRVVDFSVLYLDPAWKNIDEWVAKLAGTLGLPRPADWAAGPDENPNRILKCNGVDIQASVQGSGGSIRVRNTEYMKEMEGRTYSGEEKRRREFKP